MKLLTKNVTSSYKGPPHKIHKNRLRPVENVSKGKSKIIGFY